MVTTAYAKINLGLRILGRRSDGYHDIETIFHRINLRDELLLESTGGEILLESDRADIPTDSQNLCWRAAALLRERTGVRSGVAIKLTKHIPSGAGLGGGSSDAAAMLRTLPRLWHLQPDKETVLSVARELGSDVSFFLHQHSGYGLGRGDQLTHFPLALPYWIVLVCPSIHVSTPWAYGEYSKIHSGTRRSPLPLWNSSTGNLAEPPLLYKNDFEEIVFPAYPAIREIRDRLQTLGALYAVMSGSGASVLGLFEKEEMARTALRAFDATHAIALTSPDFCPEEHDYPTLL
jgi:4-diphosphocytidyl-2-C-methyl-D-erythritol kinase